MSILKMLAKAIWDLIQAFFQTVVSVLRNLFHPLWRVLQTTFKFQADDVKRPLLVLVSIIVIVASLISIYLSMRTPAPKINTAPFVGIGETAAEQAAKLLDGRGEVVLVVMDLGQAKQQTMVKLPAETFRDRIRKYPQIRVSTIETVQPKMETMLAPGVFWSADEFLACLNKHALADLIVTFVGVPALKPEQIAELPKRRPKIIDASTSSMNARPLIEAGIVQVALGPRFQPQEANAPEPKTPREWFERYYAVYTKDNVEVLPNIPMMPAM